MFINTCKTNCGDGYSPFPIVTRDKNTKNQIDNKIICQFYGDSIISRISNLMIKSIKGNSCLKDAQLICLSDFHFDPNQKYIRAQIVNEILAHRDAHKNLIFLVEGVQAGEQADDEHYSKLIGDHLIQIDHHALGWDNMKLNDLGIKLIENLHHLRWESKELEKKYVMLNQQKSSTIRDARLSPEKIFKRVELLENHMKFLLIKKEEVSRAISLNFDYIKKIAEKRNFYLYQSIYKVLEKCPQSIIIVVAGENHFKGIYNAVSNIKYCVLNIKTFRIVSDYDEAIKEVYGSLFNMLYINN